MITLLLDQGSQQHQQRWSLSYVPGPALAPQLHDRFDRSTCTKSQLHLLFFSRFYNLSCILFLCAQAAMNGSSLPIATLQTTILNTSKSMHLRKGAEVKPRILIASELAFVVFHDFSWNKSVDVPSPPLNITRILLLRMHSNNSNNICHHPAKRVSTVCHPASTIRA